MSDYTIFCLCIDSNGALYGAPFEIRISCNRSVDALKDSILAEKPDIKTITHELTLWKFKEPLSWENIGSGLQNLKLDDSSQSVEKLYPLKKLSNCWTTGDLKGRHVHVVVQLPRTQVRLSALFLDRYLELVPTLNIPTVVVPLRRDYGRETAVLDALNAFGRLDPLLFKSLSLNDTIIHKLISDPPPRIEDFRKGTSTRSIRSRTQTGSSTQKAGHSQTVAARARNLLSNAQHTKQIRPFDSLETHFGNASDEALHLILQLPIIWKDSQIREKRTLAQVNQVDPMSALQRYLYLVIRKVEDNPKEAYRMFDNFGHHAAIYHESLAELRMSLSETLPLQLTAQETDDIWNSYVALSDCYPSKTERINECTALLRFIFREDAQTREYSTARLYKQSRKSDSSRSSTRQNTIRADIGYSVKENEFPFGIVEFKNEAGLDGNALLEGVISYMHFVEYFLCERNMEYGEAKFPAVIIGISGNWIEVAIVTTIDVIHFNRVYLNVFQADGDHERPCSELGRMCSALRKCVDKLRVYYKALLESPASDDKDEPHLPSVTPKDPKFDLDLNFLAKLSRDNMVVTSEKVTPSLDLTFDQNLFLAEKSNADGSGWSEVVIKFTTRYNQDAHRLLQGRFAPKLHGCYDVWGDKQLLMVVMDRVAEGSGPLSWELDRSVPPEFFKEVEEAIKILHSKNFVFGDLRNVNIMVVRDRYDKKVLHPQLIDYDFVGKDGKDRYGFSLNMALRGTQLDDEVRRGGPMFKRHDLKALQLLREKYEDGSVSLRHD